MHNYVPSLAVDAFPTETFSATPAVLALIADRTAGVAMSVHSEVETLTAAKTGCVATWPAPWQPHRRAAVRDRRLGDLPSTREDGAFG